MGSYPPFEGLPLLAPEGPRYKALEGQADYSSSVGWITTFTAEGDRLISKASSKFETGKR